MTSVVGSESQRIYTHLAPFFTSVGVYFTLLIPYSRPSCWAVMVKCCPIAGLMYFVVHVGFRNGYNPYASRILAGLIFCSIGDGLLLWNRTFVHGMLAFIIGHLSYIWAFGFSPVRLPLGIVMFSLAGTVVSILYPGFRGVLVFGVPIYILVITTMVWRATARIQEPGSWIQTATCVGSILFALSDLMIGIDRFVQPLAHSQILIMSTYYAAQLGVCLSVIENR